jgi:hypothetical protein
LIHEQAKHEIADAFSLATGILQKIEVRPPRIVERDDLAVYDRVLRQVAQCIEDMVMQKAKF